MDFVSKPQKVTDKSRMMETDIMEDLSHWGGGEAPDMVSALKRDFKGWREVLLPISSVLCWEKPYHPGLLLGTTTMLFGLIWVYDLSALTTISLIGLILGLLDFSVPYFGPRITGHLNWSLLDDSQFTRICENIANFRQGIYDLSQGFITMREYNSKMFFIILMGVLSFTAWIGNLINNLLLTYIVVCAFLLTPGLQRNETTHKYLLQGTIVLRKLQAILMKPKDQ